MDIVLQKRDAIPLQSLLYTVRKSMTESIETATSAQRLYAYKDVPQQSNKGLTVGTKVTAANERLICASCLPMKISNDHILGEHAVLDENNGRTHHGVNLR
ncbi:conserved hypothetical protein [Trichinella spiralis]|uniref:Uncharacterized protein n=1 Tax=Trichinella spiralis TaxID=6334 RepID=E5SYR4_TRISP|nr:conserved hypothetical protein [Trichinella spiralis]KRY27151.1 hypothetical protein T01_5497 [Trichinella spiralis]